jgi:dihydroxyacetone kinase-like protein
MEEKREVLTRLDAALGDGDLGVYMARGFSAASKQIAGMNGTPGELLIAAGRCLSETSPSTLGTLIGTAIVRAGKTASDCTELAGPELVAILRTACDEIAKRGKAKPGEKTILDAVYPAVDAMEKAIAAGQRGKELFATAAEAAVQGETKSRDFAAVHGRPAYFGKKTIGMQDGGAVTGVLIFQGIHEVAQ